jgi:hypothetical protein
LEISLIRFLEEGLANSGLFVRKSMFSSGVKSSKNRCPTLANSISQKNHLAQQKSPALSPQREALKTRAAPFPHREAQRDKKRDVQLGLSAQEDFQTEILYFKLIDDRQPISLISYFPDNITNVACTGVSGQTGDPCFWRVIELTALQVSSQSLQVRAE